jgi:hypothetical protein
MASLKRERRERLGKGKNSDRGMMRLLRHQSWPEVDGVYLIFFQCLDYLFEIAIKMKKLGLPFIQE